LKESINSKDKELKEFKMKVEEYEDNKKFYENFNALVKEFKNDCGKEIDYKEIVKKHITDDGEKSLALYIYTLNMKNKSLREESENCNKCFIKNKKFRNFFFLI
jgi:uncharacterized protein with von Willebrand factor type A (vWA) domain